MTPHVLPITPWSPAARSRREGEATPRACTWRPQGFRGREVAARRGDETPERRAMGLGIVDGRRAGTRGSELGVGAFGCRRKREDERVGAGWTAGGEEEGSRRLRGQVTARCDESEAKAAAPAGSGEDTLQGPTVSGPLLPARDADIHLCRGKRVWSAPFLAGIDNVFDLFWFLLR